MPCLIVLAMSNDILEYERNSIITTIKNTIINNYSPMDDYSNFVEVSWQTVNRLYDTDFKHVSDKARAKNMKNIITITSVQNPEKHIIVIMPYVTDKFITSVMENIPPAQLNNIKTIFIEHKSGKLINITKKNGTILPYKYTDTK